MEAKITDWERRCDVAEIEVANLTRRLDDIRTLETLRGSGGQAAGQVAALRRELASGNPQLFALDAANTQLKQQLLQLQQELANVSAKANQLVPPPPPPTAQPPAQQLSPRSRRSRIMKAHLDALQAVELAEREALEIFDIEPDQRDPLLNALLSGDESVLQLLDEDEAEAEAEAEIAGRNGPRTDGDEGFEEDEDVVLMEGDEAAVEAADEAEVGERSRSKSPPADRSRVDSDDRRRENDQQEAIPAEMILELMQQLGLDRLQMGYDPRIEQLPRELRELVYEQLMVLEEDRLRSPSPERRAGGAGDDDDDDERHGLMYRRASYAEELLRYRNRLLDELDGMPDVEEEEEPIVVPHAQELSEEDEPLVSLAERGDLAAVEERLLQGADPNECDSSGETALHAAVGVSNLRMVRLLLLHNSAINPPLSLCGWTPLHKAAARGNVEILRLLLEFGADIWLRKADGSRAIDLAVLNERQACVKLLEEAEATGAPDAALYRPRVFAPLQLLCAVAIRKHYLQKQQMPVDALPLPDSLKEYINSGMPYPEYRPPAEITVDRMEGGVSEAAAPATLDPIRAAQPPSPLPLLLLASAVVVGLGLGLYVWSRRFRGK